MESVMVAVPPWPCREHQTSRRVGAELRRSVRTAVAPHRVVSISRLRQKVSFYTAVGVSVLLATAVSWRACQDLSGTSVGHEYSSEAHRRLESAIEWPPEDVIFSKPYSEADNKFLIIFHCIGIGYMLLGLNTVCDLYFTQSLEVLVDVWNIKPDVAGATFMAAGGSAPELFTSLIGALFAENDVGFGTIVGSAVFNVLFVIGLCGYAAKEPIKLTWWPLFRDCTYYIFSLAILTAFSANNLIAIHEAIILFCCYLGYCTIMYFNPKLEELVDFEYQKVKKQAAPMPPTAPAPGLGGNEAIAGDVTQLGKPVEALTGVVPRAPSVYSESECRNSSKTRGSPTGRDEKPRRSVGRTRTSQLLTQEACARHNQRMATAGGSLETSGQHGAIQQSFMGSPDYEEALSPPAKSDKSDELEDVLPAPMKQPSEPPPEGDKEAEEEDDEPGLLEMPEGAMDRIVWVVSLPVYVLIYYGIPEPSERCFWTTFFLSLLWIAGFSFLLVWWVEIVGGVMGLKTLYMSFTVLAAGTSIPDAVSSVAVARQGQGDMALSSSIGSNIFDILVGLPVPWIIKIMFVEMIGHGNHDYQVRILSEFITFYVLLLLVMVMLVVLSIHFQKWTLSKSLGVCMAVLYVLFLVVVLTVEDRDIEFFKFKR